MTSEMSASAIADRLRVMPMASTGSVVSLIPAVSMRRTGTPAIDVLSYNASRVVPGISVTIARGWPTRRLNTEDLPTLGRPTIARSNPSLTYLPNEKLAATSLRLAMVLIKLCRKRGERFGRYVVFHELDGGFEVDDYFYERVTRGSEPVRKRALELASRHAGLVARLRADDVSDGLRLSQVYASCLRTRER